MDKFGYLIIAVSLFVLLLLILLVRRDLTKPTLKVGFIGGILGLFSEFFYFRDYWRPPTLFGTAVPSLEDFVFGFSVAALGATLYPFLCKKYYSPTSFPGKLKTGVVLFVIGLAGMIIFNILLSINSILVSSFAFLTFALYIYTRREDLLIAGLITGLAMTIYIFVVYYLFATAYPNYAENYWLLYDTALGASVLGKVPVTELLWYVAWGVFAGMFYPFVTGEKLENK